MSLLLAYMSVYYMCAWYPERALELLKLKLQTVVNHYVGAGN